MLHERRPDLRNSTTHLFSTNGNFTKTCYPSFSNRSSKGWCSTRPPGDYQNKIPTADSGWGFCSNDASQIECNKHIPSNMEDDTPYTVNIFRDKLCFGKLKEGIKIDKPWLLDTFEEKLGNTTTFCVGQTHMHSFENEYFVNMTGSNYTIVTRTLQLEVRTILYEGRYVDMLNIICHSSQIISC